VVEKALSLKMKKLNISSIIMAAAVKYQPAAKRTRCASLKRTLQLCCSGRIWSGTAGGMKTSQTIRRAAAYN